MSILQNRILGIAVFFIGLIMTSSSLEFKGSGFIAGALMGIGIGFIFFIKIAPKKK
ncbi:hypothetical protein ACFQ0R_04335 [Psychroflexus salinarum]|uniref:PEP-CTERM protein-sorting domain-containing protein n=1 Tax=Psychroflexus salinarum TaxID=546024 RepID=A0ABW3GPB0_9FLAO